MTWSGPTTAAMAFRARSVCTAKRMGKGSMGLVLRLGEAVRQGFGPRHVLKRLDWFRRYWAAKFLREIPPTRARLSHLAQVSQDSVA